MGWGLGLAAASAVYSGYTASRAANTQADAERQAAETQMAIYQQQRADLMPYMQAGYGALSQIQANLPEYNRPFTQADFLANQDPGYQFRLQQGQNAVNRGAAASGGAVGASALQSLGNYSQGAASQEYQAAFNRYQQQIQGSYNRLASIAQLGQTGTQTATQAGTAAGQGIASNLAGIGSAQAAGQVGVANALNSGISQGMGAYQSSQLLAALQNRSAIQDPNAAYAGTIQPGVTGGFTNSSMQQLSQFNAPQNGPVPEPGATPQNNFLASE